MVNSNRLNFIGRQEQLNQIKNLIYENTKKVILIEGNGGIGKTRLLQQLKNTLSNDQDLFEVHEIIDCDFPQLNDIEDLFTQIAHQIGDERNWLSQLRVIRRSKFSGMYEYNRDKLHKFLIKSINQKSDHKKFIFLIDTAEKIGELEDTWKCISDLSLFLENSVFIFASRPELAISEALRCLPTSSATIQLKEFISEEIDTYIRSKEEQLKCFLGKKLIDRISFLSKGNPILIELCVEYAYRNVLPAWLQEETEEQLQERFSQPNKVSKFESDLIQHVTNIEAPVNRLTLLLSRVYPLDASAISKILEIPEEKSEKLFEAAKSYFFIKSTTNNLKILLHDIVRYLINEYVWKDFDQSGEWRQNDSYLASKYFYTEDNKLRDYKLTLEKDLSTLQSQKSVNPETVEGLGLQTDQSHLQADETDLMIEELELRIEEVRQQREFNTLQWLKNALYADFPKGLQAWQVVFNKVHFRKPSFAERLLNLVKQHIAEHNLQGRLTQEQAIALATAEAKVHISIGHTKEAEHSVQRLKQLLDDLSQQTPGTSLGSNQETNLTQLKLWIADVNNTLGRLYAKLHRYEDALDAQNNCLKIVRKHKPSSFSAVANQIGYLYRQLDQLDQAEAFYISAIEDIYELIDNSNNIQELKESLGEYESLLASIHNNLGYVYGEQMQYAKAKHCFREATEIWQEIGDEAGLAQVEVASAITLREQGDYGNAKKLLENALSRFGKYKEDDKNQIICRAYFHLGWTEWFAAEQKDEESWDASQVQWNSQLLEKARLFLDKSLELAQKYGLEEELPGIQHQTASVYWILGSRQNDEASQDLQIKARELNEESYRLSEKYENTRYKIDSLLGRAEFDYSAGIYDTIPHHANDLYELLGLNDQLRDANNVVTLKPNPPKTLPKGLPGMYYNLFLGRMLRIQGDIEFRRSNFESAFLEYYAKAIPKIFTNSISGPYSVDTEKKFIQNKIKQLNIDTARSLLERLKDLWLQHGELRDLGTWCNYCLENLQNWHELEEWYKERGVMSKIRAKKERLSHE